MEVDAFGFTSSLNAFFRRSCVVCGDAPLACPNCPSGEVCIQVSPSCTQCASRKCVPEAASGATNTTPVRGSGGPNIGAIAGGVIAGVVVIAAIVGAVYWFWIRKRRQRWDATQAQYESFTEKSSDYQPSLRARSATSRHSTASTARTMGSNIIQIAFIPGVTDRSADGFTPPVPPIPSSQPNSPFTDASRDHYFMPGDLRDSTYSGFTADGASTIGRRSMARSIAPSVAPSIAPSIAPSLLRQSVASAAFHEDAVTNPMPAQTAQRGRAVQVSVKSTPSISRANSRATSVPDIPLIDRKYAEPGSATTNKTAPGMLGALGFTPTSPQSIPEEETTFSSLNVSPDNASDRTDAMSVVSGLPDLKAAISEATMKASRQPTHGGLGSVRTANTDPSPFSDENRLSASSSIESKAEK